MAPQGDALANLRMRRTANTAVADSRPRWNVRLTATPALSKGRCRPWRHSRLRQRPFRDRREAVLIRINATSPAHDEHVQGWSRVARDKQQDTIAGASASRLCRGGDCVRRNCFFRSRIPRFARRAGARHPPAAADVAQGACPQVPGFRTLHCPDRSREGQRVDRSAAPHRFRDPLRIARRRPILAQRQENIPMGKLVLAAKVTHVPSLMLSEERRQSAAGRRGKPRWARCASLAAARASAASRPSSCSTRTGCPISATTSMPTRSIAVRSRATRLRT